MGIFTAPVGRVALAACCVLALSCTDDLNLDEKLFACGPTATCARGWECTDGVCVKTKAIPRAPATLLFSPRTQDTPPLSPATGCKLFTICSRTDPAPGGEWTECQTIEAQEVEPGSGLQYALPAGVLAQVRVTCGHAGGGEVMWSGRSCPVVAFEGEPVSLAVPLLPAGTFLHAADSQGNQVQLSEPRAFHETAALADGSVLAAGGIGPDGAALASAEVLLPDTGRFEAVPAEAQLSSPRAHAASVILPDGRVAVFGGIDASGEPTGSVDIWDPGQRVFGPGPDMEFPRAFHTATLLGESGQVLLAGGKGGGEHWEVWSSTQGVLSSGELLEARYLHTATAVFSGQDGALEYVLLTGGEWAADNAVSVRSTGEKLLPDGTEHTLVGLCSKQVAGGIQRSRHVALSSPSSALLFLAGGIEEPGPPQIASELCVWATNDERWQTTLELPTMEPPVYDHRSSPLDSAEFFGALLSGGIRMDDDLVPNDKAQMILVSGTEVGMSAVTIEPVPHDMLVARWGHGSVTLCDGRVMLVGGMTGSVDAPVPTDSVEVYNPK